MTQAFSSLRYTRLPEAAERFRGEVRAFLASEWTPPPPHIRARSWMGFDAELSRKLAQRGWIGLTLAPEYGGAGLDAYARFVLVEELLAVGAPVAAHWIADRQSGPLIQRFGTQAQRQLYLPRICAAQAFFCIGMSEPNSGSDLASVGSRATRGDGGWRLNGRKIWTTYAHEAHYMIALVRTSGGPADRQQGLSQFIVDLSLPGITIRPIRDLSGNAHFSEVFFDDVPLSDEALIGQEGDGWKQVNAELAFERSGPERIYSSIVLLESWLDFVRSQPTPARHAETVGRLLTHLATLRQMSIAVTAKLAQGESPVVEAALVKDLGTEFEQSIPTLISAILTEDATANADPDLIRTAVYLTAVAPTFSLRGGTREILRGMIARGLGLR